MRTGLLIALTLLSALLSGCDAVGVLFSKTGAVMQGEPKTKTSFSLEGKSLVILVDVANQDLLETYPAIRYRVAMAVAQELGRKRAAASIASPRDLMTYAQTEPDYNRKSAVEIGKHFGADTVLHVVVENYGLSRAAGSESFSGMAEVGLRVIDVAKAAQAYPDTDRFHSLEVKSKTGISAENTGQAETKVFDALALKISMLFVTYEVDSLPRKPEVE